MHPLALVYPHVCPVCLRHEPQAASAVCETCGEALPPITPPLCPGCGGTHDGALEVCSECVRFLRPWTRAVTAFDFALVARRLVHRLKYEGDLAVTPCLGRAVVRAWEAHRPDLEPDCVVPVPLHWFRQFRRGYNQVALVAREFSRHTGIPVRQGLRRQRYTRSQARLSLAERQRNPVGAFAPRKGFDFSGLHVLLMDDVLTTGSTLAACTDTLLAAGAARVDVLTMARA